MSKNNCTDVMVHKDRVFVSSGHGKDCALLRPVRQDDGRFTVERIWTSTLLDDDHGNGLAWFDSLEQTTNAT